jgi:predicted RNA methylase
MNPHPDCIRSHYDALLARNYVWMAGGWKSNCERNHRFFSENTISPAGSNVAIDLGAGCGFQAVPLAEAGFCVIAVDFCRQMLDILLQHAKTLPIRAVHADISSFGSWAGQKPELISCMGDTLTHLPDQETVRSLIRQCLSELSSGGKLIISCRDYSRDPAGSTFIIPVQRDADRIFLCRLDYDVGQVRVTDILYTRESRTWERVSGTYTKIRIGPDLLEEMMTDAGFTIAVRENGNGIITIIGQKSH